MTIREYLKGRTKRARRVVALGAVVAVVAIAISAMTKNPSAVLVAAGGLGVAIMFAALLYLDLTKCPICRMRLGARVANQYHFNPRVNFCPFCGVGFDKAEVRSP